MDDDHITSKASATFDEALGRTIQVLRTDQGQSRRTLAERAAISYSYLSAIENGSKTASSRTLAAISGALGVHLHELMAAAEARVAPLNASMSDAFGANRAAMAGHETLAERLPTSSQSGRVEELRAILDELDDDDADFVIQMARKLGRSARQKRRR